MSKVNDGGSIHLLSDYHHTSCIKAEGCRLSGGLSIRDWFAGQALSALVNHEGAVDCTNDEIAADAYRFADAMLAKRKATP